MNHKPLIVIVGPTASGKSSLAMKLAQEFDGEIIAADSRTVYRGMDIGTAKPTHDDRLAVAHWGLDLVEPDEDYSAGKFKHYAQQAIADIRSRGKLPILVGGTGLYVFSVVYDSSFPEVKVDYEKREKLLKMTTEELKLYCIENNINLPKNDKNKRHLISAIERNGHALSKRDRPIDNCIIVGITTEKEDLSKKIYERAQKMIDDGLVRETKSLIDGYGEKLEAMKGNAYAICAQLLNSEIDQREAVDRISALDRKLAKRQLTWLKRSEHITWLELGEAYTYLARILGDLNKSWYH